MDASACHWGSQTEGGRGGGDDDDAASRLAGQRRSKGPLSRAWALELGLHLPCPLGWK